MPKPAKFNGDGEEIEPPTMQVTFIVDMDRIGPFIARIARAFRDNKAINLVLDIQGEQMALFDTARGRTKEAATT